MLISTKNLSSLICRLRSRRRALGCNPTTLIWNFIIIKWNCLHPTPPVSQQPHLLKGLSILVWTVNIWATTWQNQQNEYAPSKDSDQPKQLRTQCFFVRTAKTLIRLGGCPCWSESSLGAHSFCWFCHVVAHLHFKKFDVYCFNK